MLLIWSPGKQFLMSVLRFSLSCYLGCCGAMGPILCYGTLLAGCSESGVQQGDPLGPLLFALVLQKLVSSLDADDECAEILLQAWYLDDGALAGTRPAVLSALHLIEELGPALGLHVNLAKCELFSRRGNTSFPLPNLEILVDVAAVDLQVAVTLLCMCGSFCRMVHIARVSPSSLASDAPSSFDEEVKQCFAMCSAINVTNNAWSQAQLGPKFGGLDLCSLSHHAAAFIASLSFSGLGSADNIHLHQFCSGLSHSPEGLVRNDPSTTVPHLVGVFLPCQQSSPPAGAAALAAEAHKLHSNGPKCQELGWSCIPLVVETYGNWGKEAHATFSRLASYLAIHHTSPKSAVVAEIYGRLNIALVHSIARAILVRELPPS
eukprot:Em0010g867a